MQVILSSDKQQTDPEWLIQLAKFLDKSGNGERFETAKKIFYETYLEYIREEMNPKVAMQKSENDYIMFFDRTLINDYHGIDGYGDN